MNYNWSVKNNKTDNNVWVPHLFHKSISLFQCIRMDTFWIWVHQKTTEESSSSLWFKYTKNFVNGKYDPASQIKDSEDHEQDLSILESLCFYKETPHILNIDQFATPLSLFYLYSSL